MNHSMALTNGGGRQSSVELLKIFAILLVVLSHVVQTLTTSGRAYFVDITHATASIQTFLILLLRHSGVMGNSLFFVCSSWFLLDKKHSPKQKIMTMFADVWVISVGILLPMYFLWPGGVTRKEIIESFLPNLYGNNWYITCYLLFLFLYPFLNVLIYQQSQQNLLRIAGFLLIIYVGINFFKNSFFPSSIILWVAIYFGIAYMKLYLKDFTENVKANIVLLFFGIIGKCVLLLITNIIGLRIPRFSGYLMHWERNANPFLLLSAVAMLNLVRKLKFQNQFINCISGLSLFIYLIHENILVREYIRPAIWQFLYSEYGHKYVIVFIFGLTAAIFLCSAAVGYVYSLTIHRLVHDLCGRLYPVLAKGYIKVERLLLKLH